MRHCCSVIFLFYLCVCVCDVQPRIPLLLCGKGSTLTGTHVAMGADIDTFVLRRMSVNVWDKLEKGCIIIMQFVSADDRNWGEGEGQCLCEWAKCALQKRLTAIIQKSIWAEYSSFAKAALSTLITRTGSHSERVDVSARKQSVEPAAAAFNGI